MPTITEGTIRLFTFKDGLLSRFGHDLELSLTRFGITADGERVEAHFDARSIVVVGAVEGGKLAPQALSARDRDEILDALRRHVLRVESFPEVLLRGNVKALGSSVRDADTLQLDAELDLVGRRQPISLSLARGDGRLLGSTTLVPSRWGIQPYRALLGALRVQDRVEVSFDLLDPATQS